MWCVPKLTTEFIERMEHILDLYELPYKEKEPVVCIDEKSKQLLNSVRTPLPLTEHAVRRVDYEYKRNGTRHIFCAVEPKGGRRRIAVTKRRTKRDFATFVATLAHNDYPDADLIHIVCDNLNTHFSGSFSETFGTEEGESHPLPHSIPLHTKTCVMAGYGGDRTFCLEPDRNQRTYTYGGRSHWPHTAIRAREK